MNKIQEQSFIGITIYLLVRSNNPYYDKLSKKKMITDKRQATKLIEALKKAYRIK